MLKLNGPEGLPELRENHGFAANDIGRIRTVLADNRITLLGAWEKIRVQS